MKKWIVFTLFAVLISGCSSDDNSTWDDSVIPMSLKGIKAVNIDNSGEIPVETVSSIKKEAYLLGIKWVAGNTPTDDDKFITGSISKGQQLYNSIADRYSKAVMCLTPFNADIPAGSYVSRFFKEIDRDYLPTGINEGFVLLLAPDPGEHAFRMEYYDGKELAFSYDTPLIEFY